MKGQLKFLEEIDRAEKVRHDDEERAALIKAARVSCDKASSFVVKR